jgi:Flp pilus assembly CpaF family ATPase
MQHTPTRTSVEWAEEVAETLRIETTRGTLTQWWKRPVDDAVLSLFGEPRLPLDVWANVPWYGPIEDWRKPEHEVSDILFNGPPNDPFFVLQRGAMTNTSCVVHPSWIWFVQRQFLLRSRKIDPQTFEGMWAGPYAHGVADRMRYAITAPPFSRDGGSLAIRLLPEQWRTLDDLMQQGAITSEAVLVLRAALESGASIMVSGATGSGKTTLAAGFTQDLGKRQRLVFVEDGGELPRTANSLHLEVNSEGDEFYRALKLALRQKPSFIIVGEVRGGEAMAMLQAASTGHPGICTIHAPNVQGALRNLERMAMMGLASQASGSGQAAAQIVRGLITSDAVNLIIVQIGTTAHGRRSVRAIEEVLPAGSQGQSGDHFPTNTLFKLDDYTSQLIQVGNINAAWGLGRY